MGAVVTAPCHCAAKSHAHVRKPPRELKVCQQVKQELVCQEASVLQASRLPVYVLREASRLPVYVLRELSERVNATPAVVTAGKRARARAHANTQCLHESVVEC